MSEREFTLFITGLITIVITIIVIIGIIQNTPKRKEEEAKRKAFLDEFLNSEYVNDNFPAPLYIYQVNQSGSNMIYQAGHWEFMAEGYRYNNHMNEFYTDGQIVHSFPYNLVINRCGGPYRNMRDFYFDPKVHRFVTQEKMLSMYQNSKQV